MQHQGVSQADYNKKSPLVSHKRFAASIGGGVPDKTTDWKLGNSETVVVPCHAICTMSAAEWKKKCEEEWSLQSAPMPDGLDWKSVYEAKPFGRNLLMNPAPYGTISLLHTLRSLFCCLSLIHRKFGLQTDGIYAV